MVHGAGPLAGRTRRFSLLMSFQAAKQDLTWFVQFYSFLTPLAFAWAALIAARNFGWSSQDQCYFLSAVFFGCFGLDQAATEQTAGDMSGFYWRLPASSTARMSRAVRYPSLSRRLRYCSMNSFQASSAVLVDGM